MPDLIRNAIRNLSQYSLAQYPHKIKLNQNENPYELPLAIKQEIAAKLVSMNWSRYPAFIPQGQIDLVASFTGWQADGILLGNGSNDLLQLLFTTILERGTSVVLSQPTFTLYGLLARGLGAQVHDVLMRPGFLFDVDEIIRVSNVHDAAMLVLCSPNNPTGTCLSEKDIVKILDSTRALVVLDEAYVHFHGHSSLPLLKTSDRLVILQTFSKAMGAAGIRFGYSLSSPEITRELKKVQLPYGVNIFTLLAAEVLISRWDMIGGWIQTIISERGRVQSALEHISGMHAYSSGGNFLLLELSVKKPRDVFRALLNKGILVRDVSSYPMLRQGLRITIGTPGENDQLLEALREVV